MEAAEGNAENDELLQVSHYSRTRQQQIDIGLLAGDKEEAVLSSLQKFLFLRFLLLMGPLR